MMMLIFLFPFLNILFALLHIIVGSSNSAANLSSQRKDSSLQEV